MGICSEKPEKRSLLTYSFIVSVLTENMTDIKLAHIN